MKINKKLIFEFLKSPRLIKTLRLIVLAYFLFWITNYLIENKAALIVFTEIEIVSIIFLTSLFFITVFFSALQFQAILKYCNCQLLITEVFWLNAYNSALNLLLPLKSGIAFRGYYLNKKYVLKWKKYIYASLASQFLLILTPFLLSVFIYCFYYLNVSFSLSLAFFIIPLIGLILIAVHYSEHPCTINSKNKEVQQIVLLFIHSFGFALSWSCLLYFCFIFLGFEYYFYQIFLLQSLLLVTSLINITPGNIGVKEGAAFLTASYLGINNEHAVFALLLERSIYSVIIILVGGIGLISNKVKINEV